MSERDDKTPGRPGETPAGRDKRPDGGAAPGEGEPEAAEDGKNAPAAAGSPRDPEPGEADEPPPRPGETTRAGEIDARVEAPEAGGEGAPGEAVGGAEIPDAGDDALPDVPPWADDLPALAGVRADRRPGSSPGGPPPPRRPRVSRRALAYGAGALAGAALVAGLIAASWANSRGYYLVCETEEIRAERGRWLPWGRASLGGDAYEPIPISRDADCTDLELETESELAEHFTRALLDRAGELLASGDDRALSGAERQLDQALLLTRGPERRAARDEIANLRGDLDYRRAAGEIDAALERLDAAAATFSEAAARDPRHHDDAEAWADHARRTAEALRAGPDAAAASASPGAAPSPAEPGAGRPMVGPERPGDPADDPGDEPAPTAERDEKQTPTAVDDDLPQGGVLL